MKLARWYEVFTRSTRNNFLVLSVIAAAIFAVVVVISLVEIFSIHEDVYYEYATSKAYADAQEKFRDECRLGTSIQEVISCFEDAVETARETQRFEEDLHAQKQMAVWAKWMLIATLLIGVVSIGVAVAGVLLVNRTLRLQRLATEEAANATRAATAANELAREAFVVDQRPWLAVARCEPAGTFRLHEYGCYFKVRVFVQNTGKTPALNVGVIIKPYVSGDTEKLRKEYASFAARKKIRNITDGATIFPGQQ